MVLQTLRIKCWAPALQRSGDGTLASKLLVSAKNRLTAAEWGVGAEAFLKPNHVSAKPDQNRDKSDKLKNTYSSPQTGRTVLNCIRSCSQELFSELNSSSSKPDLTCALVGRNGQRYVR